MNSKEGASSSRAVKIHIGKLEEFVEYVPVLPFHATVQLLDWDEHDREWG